VYTDHHEGMRGIADVEDVNTPTTRGDGAGVRVVSARSWLEGGEEGQGGDLDIGGELEDLDEQLFHIVQTVPSPCTVAHALRLATVAFPDRAPWLSGHQHC